MRNPELHGLKVVFSRSLQGSNVLDNWIDLPQRERKQKYVIWCASYVGTLWYAQCLGRSYQEDKYYRDLMKTNKPAKKAAIRPPKQPVMYVQREISLTDLFPFYIFIWSYLCLMIIFKSWGASNRAHLHLLSCFSSVAA